MELKEGLSYTASVSVSDKNSARAVGSGGLDVFGTPSMVALMELSAMTAVAPYLPDGNDTVGVEVNIAHIRATPLGETVTATATLTKIDGRKLDFDVAANDSQGEIGRGTHARFIVDREKFMGKLRK
ncbi:MAG: thioesterase family protein [Rikenellaceae bacterium]|jgi:predicted thioesterase|nr:thioesterase family protein [Rikenellaceae bacterium]